MKTRNELARNAFWGSNEALMNVLCEMDSYTENGIEWPSNSMSLARAIELVESLTDEQMDELEAVGVI